MVNKTEEHKNKRFASLDNHEVLATERESVGQAQRSNLGTAFGLHKIWIILAAPQHCSSKLGTAFGLHKISRF